MVFQQNLLEIAQSFHCQNAWSGQPVLTFGKRPKFHPVGKILESLDY